MELGGQLGTVGGTERSSWGSAVTVVSPRWEMLGPVVPRAKKELVGRGGHRWGWGGQGR